MVGSIIGSSEGSIVSPMSSLLDIQSNTTDSEYEDLSVLERDSENCSQTSWSRKASCPESGIL